MLKSSSFSLENPLCPRNYYTSLFMTLLRESSKLSRIIVELMRGIKRLQANICTQSDLGEVHVVAPLSGLRTRAPKGISPPKGRRRRIHRRMLPFSMRSRIPRRNTCLLRQRQLHRVACYAVALGSRGTEGEKKREGEIQFLRSQRKST